jgi:hypothetical protein
LAWFKRGWGSDLTLYVGHILYLSNVIINLETTHNTLFELITTRFSTRSHTIDMIDEKGEILKQHIAYSSGSFSCRTY